MAYEGFKDLTRRIASDKLLRDKAFNIAKNPKSDGYQRGLASMVYNIFDKKTAGGATTLANKFDIKMRIFLIKNWQKNYTNQLLVSLKKEKYNHLL